MIGVYRDGRRRAELAWRAQDQGAAADILPISCPYDLDEILLEDWYPDRPGAQP
jgi:hypothetical protein